MRGGQNESMSSVLARRGIRPNITVDTMPGQPEEAPLPQPNKNFAEELFSSGIPHEMKLKLMQLYDKGGDAQSFNEGLYSEDYNGMDHDFKGKLSGLYGNGAPAPVGKKGKGKKGRKGMIGKPMPTRSGGKPFQPPAGPDKDDGGIDTDNDMEIGETKPPSGMGGPAIGKSVNVGGGKPQLDMGIRRINPRPVTGGGNFDPQKLAMLMQMMQGGGQ